MHGDSLSFIECLSVKFLLVAVECLPCEVEQCASYQIDF